MCIYLAFKNYIETKMHNDNDNTFKFDLFFASQRKSWKVALKAILKSIERKLTLPFLHSKIMHYFLYF